MQEYFLHFVWQYQYFSKQQLRTSDGQLLQVLATGFHNDHAGPDFSQSRLRIGDLEWHGHTEIHCRSSDWLRHQHQHDPAYNQVILHVVWDDDREILRSDGTRIPTLVLKDRVTLDLIDRYQKLTDNPMPIPCEGQVAQVADVVRLSMLDKALVNRLENKAKAIEGLLQATDNNWEEVAYRWLCQNFGFKVNQAPFAQLAQALPASLLTRHSGDLKQVEALLFGQAGFLEGDLGDGYGKSLQAEYEFLAHKYQLYTQRMRRHQWLFLRMRPANFPTVRLAQLAQLVHHQPKVFSLFKYAIDLKDYSKALSHPVSDYWSLHYDFGKKRRTKAKGMGRSSIENLVINTATPLLVAYSRHTDAPAYMEKAVSLLQSVKAENNHIIRQWQALGITCKNAFDSQALLELYHSFCQRKRCLSCSIGTNLIKVACS